jgi:hypothetical protein
MHPGTKTLAKVYRISDAAIDRWLAKLASGEVVRLDPDEPMPDGARFLWHLYAETRDVKTVQFVEGETPETFHVRTLSKSESREAMLRGSDVERQEFAFARGLVRVDKLELDTGERRDWTRPHDGSDKPKPIPEKIVEEHFDPATVWEIGEVICQLSFYRRQSERTFALPRTSLDALRVIARRPVGQTSGSSNSAKTKLDLAPTSATPMSSPDGDGSTGVTAMDRPSTSSMAPALSTDGPPAVSI